MKIENENEILTAANIKMYNMCVYNYGHMCIEL